MELGDLYSEFLRYLRSYGQKKPNIDYVCESIQVIQTDNWIFTLNLN